MAATDRLSSEQAFHDWQARQRAAVFAARPGDLLFDDDAYVNHESWIDFAFQQLGELYGRRVLDYGCGHGMAAVVLARRGARVTALDLSPAYLEEAAQRARANNVSIDFIQAEGETLPFGDGVFDSVWGNAILHHLDAQVGGRELYRVLRPGGVAVLAEPWGGNPLLNWARQRLPYAGKARTADERPLRRRDVAALRKIFPHVEMKGFQLLSMARRVIGKRRIVERLDQCDRVLLRGLPVLQRLCRYVVLTLRR